MTIENYTFELREETLDELLLEGLMKEDCGATVLPVTTMELPLFNPITLANNSWIEMAIACAMDSFNNTIWKN
jgi:hypothetical protein